MNEWTEYAKFTAGLLGIVNPIGAIPIFVGLTANQPRSGRRRTSFIASISVAIVLGASLLTGEWILNFFGISIASFRVGSGILILLIAISMLQARIGPETQTQEEVTDAAEKESIAVVPIGIPLLAGPGAISTIVVQVHRGSTLSHYVILGAEILFVAGVVWLCLRSAHFIALALGRTGINVITRIMGLIIAAIGIEFIANGMKQLFPALN